MTARFTAQKMKFQETAYLVTFTQEILNGKLHFLRSGYGVYGMTIENIIQN